MLWRAIFALHGAEIGIGQDINRLHFLGPASDSLQKLHLIAHKAKLQNRKALSPKSATLPVPLIEPN